MSLLTSAATVIRMNQLPNREIIIIGGGAVGCGVAYALAKAGQTDVLLIERADDVGQVTTSQGAGLCGQVRGSAERIKLAMHSVAVFRDLQKSDVKPDWHEVGSLRVALSDKRAEEFRSLKQAAQVGGLVPVGRLDDAAVRRKILRARVSRNGRLFHNLNHRRGNHGEKRTRDRREDEPRFSGMQIRNQCRRRARVSHRETCRSGAAYRARAPRVLRHGADGRPCARSAVLPRSG
ncbi:MAG: hypothetical protein DME22_26525, partial [Verrucomicrobia bacterium]